jgi:osmotically-inducible protein OsmY
MGMKVIPQVRIRTHYNVFSALSAAALGCSLAYWVAKQRHSAAAPTAEGASQTGSAAEIDDAIPMPDPDDLGDDLVAELVSSEIALNCANPGAVTVICLDGIVTLQGTVQKDEIHRVLKVVARVPGVHEIHDHLEARRAPIAIARTPRRPARRPVMETVF